MSKGRVKLLNSVAVVVAMVFTIMWGLAVFGLSLEEVIQGPDTFDVARRLIRGSSCSPVATRNGMNVEVSTGWRLTSIVNGCVPIASVGPVPEMCRCKQGKGRSDYERKSQDYRLTLGR